MRKRILFLMSMLVAMLSNVSAQTATKVASASELTDGLYIIKDVVTNTAQENRRGYVYLNSSLALSVNTTDRTKTPAEILSGSSYSVEYIWRLKKVGDKWTIASANSAGLYFPNLTGNGQMTANTTAGQYLITDHASGNGTLSLKCGNTFVNADPGTLSGWSNAHEMELYKISGTTDDLIDIIYQTPDAQRISTVQVYIPACKGTSDMTYMYNCPEGYGITARSGNTVTVMATLKDGQTYYIASDNRSAQYYLTTNGTALTLSNTRERSTAYMWTCVKNGTYYTFRNVETGKWLAHKTIANTAYNFTIDPTKRISEGCLPLYSVAAARYMLVKNDGSGFDQATGTYNKNTTNFTSDYIFTECNPLDVMMSESFSQANWLRMSNGNNTGYVMTSKGATANNGTAVSDASSNAQLYAFVGDMTNGFVIYNKALGSSYTLTAANTSNGTAATWAQNAATPTKWYIIDTYANAAQKPGYVITTSKTSDKGLNMYGGAGGDTKFYNASDGGTHWNISMVDSNPTIIHYAVSGTKKFNDANQWVGKLKITKGSFSSESYITEDQNGQVFNAYLPKSSDAITFSNYNLHGWKFTHEEHNGEHYVTYTADTETEYQYLGFRPDAQWYRIPAIVSAKNGDLVSIYDWRVCHNDVGFGEVDQAMRRSNDFGRTWTEEKIIADGKGNGKVFGAAFGDPALVADRESSNMTLITVSGTTAYPYANATDHNLISVQFSNNNGATWSEPQEITSQFWGNANGMFADADTEDASTTFAYAGFFGSGKILQSRVTKVGDYYRIYAAMLCRGKNVQGAYVVYSDDMGHNWKLLGGDNTIKAAPGSDEPKVEELPNGDIVLSCRKYYGRYFNIWKWSTLPTKEAPLGAGQWGSVVDSNTIPTGIKVGGNSCNGEILYVKAKKADDSDAILMLQSLPSGNDRSGVEIWYKDVTDASSYSDVTTFASNWTRGLRVSPQSPEGFSAYSTMTVQQDGRIGFIFEEGPATYCIVYVPLTIEQITNNAYKAIEVNMPTAEYIQAVSDLKNAYAEKAGAELGDGWLDYVSSNPAAMQSALEAAEPYVGQSIMELFNAPVCIETLQSLTAALQAVTIVQKCKKGCFVRIKGYSDNYVSVPTAGSNGMMSNATDKTTIMYLSPEGEIISYGTGLGLTSTSIAGTTGLNHFTVLPGAQQGKYYLKSNATGIGTYLYDNTAKGTKVDRIGSPVTSGSYQTDWTLEEVTSLPITMNQYEGAYYCTISVPVAVTLPAGMKAYSAVVDEDVLKMTKVAGSDEAADILATNTPVVLYAPSKIGTLTSSDETGATADNNDLHGAVVATSAPANSYIFSNGQYGLGFYKPAEGKALTAFKAYLTVEPQQANVPAFRMMFEDETTGVGSILSSPNETEAIYNISGVRQNKLQHGINIVGGKKMVIK